MINRDEFIEMVNGAVPTQTYSSREIAALIGVPHGTLSGWLSDKRAFPVSEVGSRGARVYDLSCLKRLAIYLGATTQGLGLNGGDVKVLIAQLEVDSAWVYYALGLSELAGFLLGKRKEILGE